MNQLLRITKQATHPLKLKFTSPEVTVLGSLALLKRTLDGSKFKAAVQSRDLTPPRSSRGYAPAQLIERMIVRIWCGAFRCAHANITPLDATLVRLFDWGYVKELGGTGALPQPASTRESSMKM